MFRNNALKWIFILSFWVSPLLYCLSINEAVADDDYNLAIPGDYKMPGFVAGRSVVTDTGTEIIDPFSGLLKLNYQDLVVPGNGGLDIVVQRYYNSVQNPSVAAGSALRGRSVVGIGWDMHFGRVFPHAGNLIGANDTPSACKINNVSSKWNPVLELADGTRKQLVNDDSSDYSFTTGDFWKATCLPTSENKGAGGLVVYSPDGLIYVFADFGYPTGFDTSKRAYFVTRIEDANGNTLEFEYENVYPQNGLGIQHAVVTKVSASDGRIVNFDYTDIDNENALLSGVKAYGKSVSYHYDKVDGENSEDALMRVTRQDGSSWKYTYYPLSEVGSGTAFSDPPGWKSIKTIENPYGAITTYTYDLIDFDGAGVAGEISSVITKETRGNVNSSGRWEYTYTPGRSYDETQIKSDQDCVIYRHRGQQSLPNPVGGIVEVLWRKGTLLNKFLLNKTCSTVLQEESYEWGGLYISAQNEIRPLPLAVAKNTYSPLLIKKTIERKGTTYVTEYLQHDNYGNPQKIEESQDNQKRTTHRTFTLPDDVWMPHLVDTESIEGIAGQIDNDYYDNGNLSASNVYGAKTTYTYHRSSGEIKTIKDPNGNITEYNDYFRGVARSITRPEDVTITRVVDDYGNLESETIGTFTTAYSYDALNRLKSVATPRQDDNNVSVDYAYTGAGLLRTVTRGPLIQEYEYDGLGSLVARRAKGEETITVTAQYDQLGRRTFVTYPNQTVGTETIYDALGRVEKRLNPDSSAINYSYISGDKVRVVDEEQKTTDYTYLSYGGSGEPWLVKIEAPENVTTTIVRHANGLIDTVTQNGIVVDYSYNDRWQLHSETRPETGVTIYGRDKNGNMTSKQVGAFPVTLYKYDGLNRLDFIDYPDGTPDIDYDYDKRSNLKLLSKGNLVWRYQYDDNSNLKEEKLSYQTQQFIIARSYNANDAVSGLTYPNGEAIAFSPDTYGRQKQLGVYVSDVSYYPNGQVKSFAMANGVETTYGQSERLFPGAINVTNLSSKRIDKNYIYDNVGNVTDIIDNLDSANTLSLGYDDLYRLTSATGRWGAGTIDYDDWGNIEHKSMGDHRLDYSYDELNTYRLDRVSGSATYAYDYDDYGNVISNGEQTFTYDDVPNMVTVPDLAMSYEYDGYNRRTVTIKNGAIQKYSIYSASGQLLFEYNALTDKNTTHFYLGSQLITSKEVCSEVDTDGDGLADCMEKQVGLDPEDPSDASSGADLDNDGLGNLLEISLGLDPTSPEDGLADNDDDGYSNRQEIWVGTNPNDGDSKPSLLPGETDFPGIRGWAMGIDAGSITGTSIAPDGSLYIGVQDKSDSSAVVNYLYHLGPGGNVIWNKKVSGLISKPPTVAMDGTVYVAAGENLYAINADGTEKWIIDGIHSNARASLGNDGSVYVASNKQTLMALDPETGVQRWKFPEDHSPFDINITEDIVVDSKGTIYLVSSKIGLVSLTPEGELKSTYHYFSQPVIGIDGTLYISENNRLVAVDGDTGIEKWRFTYSGTNRNLTSPVIDSNGTVIVGTGLDYLLIALDAENGTIKWRKPSGGDINRPPTIGADNRIYVSVGYYLLCFNESGELLWSHLIGNTVNSSATLASDGTVYVSAGAAVYAVVDDTSGLANSPWPYHYHDSAGSGNQCRSTDKIYSLTADSDADWLSDCIEYVGGYDPQAAFDYPEDLDDDGLSNSEELDFGTNRFKSDTDYDGLSDSYEIQHQFNPLDVAEGLLDQDNDGFSNRAEMIAGSDPLLSTSKPEIGVPGKRRRIMRGEMIGIAHSKSGNIYMTYWNNTNDIAGNGVVSYREDGTYRRTIGLKNRPLGPPVIGSDGTIYVKTLYTDLLAISPEGKILWNYDTLYYSGSEPAIAADGTVYIGTWYTSNELHAISPKGELKWKKNPPRRIYHAPVIDQKGVVYAGGETYITAYTSEGEELWSKEYQVNGFTFNITGRMALSINGVLYAAGYVRNDSRLPEGYLLAIDTDTGKLIWTYKTLVGNNNNSNPPVSGSHSPVIGPDGTIYISYAKKPLYAISPGGKLKWSYQTSNTSSYLQPQIGKDGSIHTTKSSSFYHHQDIVILNPDGTERWSQTLPSAAKSFSYLTEDGVLNVLNARLDFSYRDTTCVWHMLPTEIGGKSGAPWPIVGQNELGNSQMAPLAMVINSPLSGTASVTGDVVKLAVTAKDVTDGDLSASVTWRSSIDGDLGEGAKLEVHLSPGIHQIWATITNSDEKTISVPTMINVNQRPELSVGSPIENGSYIEGETIDLTATALDEEDGDISPAITWTSDIDGDLGTGGEVSVTLSPGAHQLTATVRDSSGLETSVQININVTTASTMTFTQPVNHSSKSRSAMDSLREVA